MQRICNSDSHPIWSTFQVSNFSLRLGNHAVRHLHRWSWAHNWRPSHWSSPNPADSEHYARVQVLHPVLRHFLRQTQRCKILGNLRICFPASCQKWRWNRYQKAAADHGALLYEEGHLLAEVFERIYEADVRLERLFGLVHHRLACWQWSKERQKVRTLRS